jgi:hypothetical protein
MQPADMVWPDDLSDWALPPPSVRDARPVRVFGSPQAALAFLAEAQERARRAAPEPVSGRASIDLQLSPQQRRAAQKLARKVGRRAA